MESIIYFNNQTRQFSTVNSSRLYANMAEEDNQRFLKYRNRMDKYQDDLNSTPKEIYEKRGLKERVKHIIKHAGKGAVIGGIGGFLLGGTAGAVVGAKTLAKLKALYGLITSRRKAKHEALTAYYKAKRNLPTAERVVKEYRG